MRRIVISLSGLATLALVSACVNVKAPENIEIGGKSYTSGSSRAPNPGSLDECRTELNRAYNRIDSLERRCDSLEKDKKKYKEERDEWKEKYEKLKDRYD